MNIKFLYFIVILYFIQLYYLIYINDNKSIFMFIVTLLIINFYYNNIIISILLAFFVLYSLYILQLLNNQSLELYNDTVYHYIVDKYEPKIENGILLNDFESGNKNVNEIKNVVRDNKSWLDFGYINELINNSKLIVQ